jgi:uncharacterized protein (TIGR00299 family) protein
MKKLFLQCNMGASGDMLAAALFDLISPVQQENFLQEMNNLGLKNVKVFAKTGFSCAIKGISIEVNIDGHVEGGHSCQKHSMHHHKHHGASLKEIYENIESLNISQKIREQAKSIFSLIAQAESCVHQKPTDTIHFHEVGSYDAIVDIVGVCRLIELVAADKIYASPINTGFGFVQCLHGLLPVPAPATAILLKDIPVFCGQIEGELCTPTGAALIKFFVKEFTQNMDMQIEKIGYGLGKKEFKAANCLRAFLSKDDGLAQDLISQEFSVLECNLDDMTGEEIGFVFDLLFESGALDVWICNVQMKKNRPAVLLSMLCQTSQVDFFVELLLKRTSSFGVRQFNCIRHKLNREIETIQTSFGEVRVKKSLGKISKQKFEYEDIMKIAKEKKLNFREVVEKIIMEKANEHSTKK